MGIKIYFGVPGSGKTTLAAKLVHDNLKRGIKTFTNVPIKGGILFDSADIGKVDISDGCMVLDEAGIAFNNRKFRTLSQNTIEWLKLHRHYGIREIYVFSQSYDDMDITLRRLADEIYVVKRSLIPCLFSTKRIKVKVGIDDESHQIIDQYYFQFLGIKSYFGFHYWHMFDSWSAPELPVVQWYYSSYGEYTINKKHSKLIYKELHRQGKLTYKFMQWIKRLFAHKNNDSKRARELKQFFVLSRIKVNTIISEAKESARACREKQKEKAVATAEAVMPAYAASTASVDVDEAFLAFFQNSPSQRADAEEKSALQEKEKRKQNALFSKLEKLAKQ